MSSSDRSRDGRDRYRRDYDRERRRDRDRSYDDRRDRDRDRSRDRDRDRHSDDRHSDEERHSKRSRDYYDEDDDSSSRASDDWNYRRPRSSYGGNGRGRWNDSIPNNIILMRGLPAEAVETDVVSELLKTGTVVKDVRLMRSKETGASLHYCFIEFHSVSEAQYWMEQNQGELLFWDQYPANMYYSTSRRGSLNTSVIPPTDVAASYEPSASDWTCTKCSCKNFQRRIYCRRCSNSRLETDRANGGDGADQVGINPCNTLILRGLDGLTVEDNIISAFAHLTSMPLKNVRVVHDRLTGTSSGYAFVELHSLKESQDLLQYLESLPTPLEVDGKALIINYAKNTFSTAIATLEQQAAAAAAAAAGHDYQQHGYYDYSSYYQQANVAAADSSNAAEVAQAAILQSQQKKIKHGNQPAILSAAPVLHHPTHAAMATASAPEYMQYPVPDVSTYVYDESSGYYYDASTGLYYDANSQYYYNTQTQQFLYWDSEKCTYLPAPMTTDAQAAAGQDVSATDAKKDEEQKKQLLTPDKKVKVAKKIVKDMEKWAKKLNAQKEHLKEDVKAPVAEPIIDISSVSLPSSASADAGFSLLEKTVYNKRLTDVVREKEATLSAAASSSGSMFTPGESESSSGPVSVEELIDWNKLACLLCRRAFPSKEVLLKHQQLSDLHKKNVEELLQRKGGGLSQDGSTLQYRDRAKERRAKYGQPEPPLPKRSKPSAEPEPETVPFEQPTAQGIKEDNVGNRLLQKMGWKDGEGLGKGHQGIVDPIEASRRQAQAGLGSRGSTFNVELTGTYKERARKTFQQYFQEIN